MEKLTHIDAQGQLQMVDVGSKPDQERVARAEGFIYLEPATIRLIRKNSIKKGDVLTTARLAGIQAAKQTPFLIPLCHTLLLTRVDVKTEIYPEGVLVTSAVHCTGKTGVEMEALQAVSTSLLTIYDMCKAVDKQMVMSHIKLVSKEKK